MVLFEKKLYIKGNVSFCKIFIFMSPSTNISFSNIFEDYENFGCVNKAYSDLTSKIFDLVNRVAPTKTIRVKNKTNE